MTTASGKTVLLVVDDDGSADLLFLHLGGAGREVRGVRDGDERLQTALNGGYDLILLDIMLPGTDGFDICRCLR